MNEKTCCFTGHRKLPESEKEAISKALETEIIKLIDNGVRYFGAGGALGFDTLAAETVLKLRKDFSDIRLILVLPCPEQAEHWSIKDEEKYLRIKAKADKVVYTSEKYTSDCMLKRNRHLVDNSAYCICYLTQKTGGTASTVYYASRCKLSIINIANKV